LRKQGKICLNLCNPWLTLVKVSMSNRSRRNIKTLSKTYLFWLICHLSMVHSLRIPIGSLRLGRLKPRRWRYFTIQEVRELKGNEGKKMTRY